MLNRAEAIKSLMLDDERIKRECERDFCEFFKHSWHILEPATPLKYNWHIEYLCDTFQEEVERVAARLPKDKDIIINISPRSLKSDICSITLVPWAWINYPFLRFINSSYSKTLAIDHCVKSRNIIEHQWYQRFWHDRFEMRGDQNVKSHFENNHAGVRFATSVEGTITGHGADIIIVDDPVDAKDAENLSAMQGAYDHYTKDLFSRLNDQEVGLRILVMQVLNKLDPSNRLMDERPDDHKLIRIPLEKTEDVHPPELAEKYGSVSFFDNRFTERVVREAKKMGDRAYSAQFNQRAQGNAGGIFKPTYWRYWDYLPDKFDRFVLSWDMSFKGKVTAGGKKGSDFVVGQAWGTKGALCYLVDQIRGQWDLPMTIQMFLAFVKKHPRATIKYVEDKANGPGVIAIFQNEIPMIVPVNPEGSKTARAHSITPLYQAGNVLLPPKDRHPWVAGYETEHENFTGQDGNIDDQVDTACQALAELNPSMSPIEQLRALVKGI